MVHDTTNCTMRWTQEWLWRHVVRIITHFSNPHYIRHPVSNTRRYLLCPATKRLIKYWTNFSNVIGNFRAYFSHYCYNQRVTTQACQPLSVGVFWAEVCKVGNGLFFKHAWQALGQLIYRKINVNMLTLVCTRVSHARKLGVRHCAQTLYACLFNHAQVSL